MPAPTSRPEQSPAPAPRVSGLLIIAIVGVLMAISALALLVISRSTLVDDDAPAAPVADAKTPAIPLYVLGETEPAQSAITWSLTAITPRELSVEVATEQASARVKLPAGLRVEVADAPQVGPLFTLSSALALVEPGRPQTLTVLVLSKGPPLDPPIHAPHPLTLRPAEAPAITCWLTTCATFKASWLVAQTGFWALHEELDIETWQERATAHTTMRGQQLPRVLRRTEQLLRQCNVETREHPLFAELVAARESLLQRIGEQVPAKELLQQLDTLELLEYDGDPVVTQRLTAIMHEHPELALRRMALSKLFQLALPYSIDTLATLLHDHAAHPYDRVLAAWTLLQHQRPYALPFLAAACDADTVIAQRIGKPVIDAISQASGRQRQRGESLFLYWRRAIGWERLRLPTADLERLGAAVEDAKGIDSPWLDAAINLLEQAPHLRPRLQAIGEVGLFINNERAWQRLVQETRSDDDKVAIMALSMLEPFGRFDRLSVFSAALADSSLEVAEAIITTAARHCDSLGELFVQALDHPEASIRERALRGLGACGMVAQQAVIARFASAEDQPESVRDAARQAMIHLSQDAAFPLLQADLEADDLARRRDAVRTLLRMGNKPEALQLLQRYRDDEALAPYIEPHLRRLNYPPPAPQPAE